MKKIPLSELLRTSQETCAKLEMRNLDLQERESQMLEAFSRIIKNADTDDYAGYGFDRVKCKAYKTWMEVAADVGKLLAKDSYSDLKNTIARTEERTRDLESENQRLRKELDLKNF